MFIFFYKKYYRVYTLQDNFCKKIKLIFLYKLKGSEKMSTTISIRLSEEEKQKLIKFAKDNDLTMSQIIRKLIKENLKN